MLNRKFYRVAPLLLCVALGARAVADEPDAEVLARFTVVVDLGQDIGQTFGSLFEARDAEGRVVAGAGFMEVYNTRFRDDRHTLQFFVRPPAGDNGLQIERLPHPDLDCGVYLLDLDQQVYAWSSVRNNSVRRWDSGKQRWLSERPPRMPAVRGGDGAMRVGTGLLVFSNNQAQFNGRQILAPPKAGTYYNFYYAQGHLCFYHRHRAETGGFTRVYACPWTAERAGLIDLAEAIVSDTKYVGETPFAWGQFREEILTVSNQGGIYVFDGRAWRTVLEADNRVSYQVYSILNYHDRLLLAQYPSGQLFEYSGGVPKLLAGWPPRLPGVSSRAREAQTMAVYRGDLFVGVWPWAELWRYDRDARKWHFARRMFSHPVLTDKFTHPYEAEANRLKLVTNHWGQRVTGLMPQGEGLLISTSSKGTSKWLDSYKFLTEKQRREYGAVLRLKMPGNIAAQIAWTGRPLKLDCVVTRERIEIRQSNKVLGSAALPPNLATDWSKLKVNWGRGVFGPLHGELLMKRTSGAAAK